MSVVAEVVGGRLKGERMRRGRAYMKEITMAVPVSLTVKVVAGGGKARYNGVTKIFNGRRKKRKI